MSLPVPSPQSRLIRVGGFVSRMPNAARPLPKQDPPPVTRTVIPDYERTPGVREALEAIDGGNPVVLVMGKAGTGKTTLIRHLQTRPGADKQIVVAPTAIAALNASAQTIHSAFMLPPEIIDPQALEPAAPSRLLSRIERVIIDEISMVRADLLDAIDVRLRRIRSSDRPFGGVQIVAVGDFFQLPPVVREEDWDVLSGLGYPGPYAFCAHALSEIDLTAVTLNTVYRQADPTFVDMLNALRVGDGVETALEQLNATCTGPHRSGRDPLILTPTKQGALGHNMAGLAALRGPVSVFRARVEGQFGLKGDSLPVPETIELRVGARVMAMKNDAQGRWFNGALGVVRELGEKQAVVEFDHSGEVHPMGPVSWERVRQTWNAGRNKVEREVLGTYTQMPLNLAWASTIHKAQGLSLDDVRIDIGGGAFADGQMYVALSRARSLAGLSLSKPLRVSDIRVDPIILSFTNEIGGI